jgi:putative ABC transport system permease protein
MLKNYLRTTLRNLTRNAATSGLNILGLAVGMTAAILIFLWVDNELTFDSYHPGASRIYRVTAYLTSAKWTWENTPLRLAPSLRNEVPGAEKVASLKTGNTITIEAGGELFDEKQCAYIDSNWFSLFHYDFLAGDATSFFHHPQSLILTESKAKKYFGDKNPIGQTLSIDTIPYRIAAVIRDNPANSSFAFDVLMPIDAWLADSSHRKEDMGWGNYHYLTFVKLHPDIDTAAANKAINAIVTRNSSGPNETRMSLTPLREIHFETNIPTHSVIHRSNRKTVYIFSILGAFLLLIACINYVNLTTARAAERAKETGIRKLVGAARSSLFTQFLIESLAVSALSLILTLLLVRLSLPLFRHLTDTTIRNPFTNPDTWKIIGTTLLAATVLNGIYPALLLSSFHPLHVLKGRILLNFKDVYLRKSLVVLQFTFSIILIAGTIIIQRQLNYIQHTQPGFDRSQLLTVWLPWQLFRGQDDEQVGAFKADLKQQLLAYPAITDVAFASDNLVGLSTANSGSADWDGHDTSYRPTVYQLNADADFLHATNLQLQQGRWFDAAHSTDRHNFILNETAVREFNLHKPVLGQRFSFLHDTGVVIGVVKDFHFASLHTKIGPLVIHNHPSSALLAYIRTAPGKIPEALAAARKRWRQYVPNKPFAYDFLDEAFDNQYKSDARTSTLILLFSGIAILISCLGLLGLAAFTARQRIREIGIRKIMGATVIDILTLLSRDFLKLVILSVLIATPIAWWTMHSWLQDFAYHIPLRSWTFVAAGLLAIGIALLTVAAQTLRAARANPVKNLRTE